MLTLYTPATGFPDLEIKIAYGLARVAIEAFGGEKVTIKDEGGFYKIKIDIEEFDFNTLNKTFNFLCKRLLASIFIPFNTPGITSRSAESISVSEEEAFSLNIYKSIITLAENRERENFCRHRLRKTVSNVLGFTAAATTGVLCKRDGVDITFYRGQPRRPTNPRDICKTCGLLALLGIWYASFIFNISDREVIIIPVPKEEISGNRLQEVFALQHQIRKERFNSKISQVVIPLVFLSKIPSSADILKGFDLFIAVLSRQQGYHVDGLFLISIENYLKFIRETPYNIAVVENIYRKDAYGALQELNNAIYHKNKSALLKFARLYVQETSPNNFTNLLYPETTRYLLKEVAMIKEEIINNTSLLSLAKTLRYFIRERKYSYVDAIRNAKRESKDFEETIAKMLREGRLRLEQKEPIHLPTEYELQEIFRLANEDFESTKLALVMLAFSFPSKQTQEV